MSKCIIHHWLTYSGDSIQIETVLFWLWHSLVDQNLRSHLGGETTTNDDGFGIGWRGRYSKVPFRYRCLYPAWNDINLRGAACAIRLSVLIAHMRAATDIPTQETNCHPFCYGRWLFTHNGLIREYPLLRCALTMKMAPEPFRWIEGSTDSEIMSFPALSSGFDRNPRGAFGQMVGLIEDIGRRHDVEHPLNMTACTTDSVQIVVTRYSSEDESRSLFHSTPLKRPHRLYPDSAAIEDADDDVFLVLSEPLVDSPDAWAEVPEETVVIVKGGVVEHHRSVSRKPGPMGFDLPTNQAFYGREAG